MDEVKTISQKHNISENSVQSFFDFNRTGQRSRQHKLVYDAIKNHQPITSRALANVTGIERTNLTRTLFDAVNTADPLVKICFDAPCPITGKHVHWYSLIDFETKENTK